MWAATCRTVVAPAAEDVATSERNPPPPPLPFFCNFPDHYPAFSAPLRPLPSPPLTSSKPSSSSPPLCAALGIWSDAAMDGDLGLTPPRDRAFAGQIKGIGGGGAGGGAMERLGGAGGCRESASTMVESVSPEWTDEKHSSYLNSMEESFVNQLYNHQFCSNNLFGWTSRISKDTDSPVSHIPSFYSGQFKVLRGGCWGEVKFERPQTQTDVRKESRVLSRNPWIRHFMITSNDQRLEKSSAEHPGSQPKDSAEIHIGRQRHDDAECREATSTNQLHACCSHFCRLDSVGSNTEVSDQNFVDDFEGAKQSSRVRKRKKSRAAASKANDQVDPSGETPVLSNGDEDLASLKEKDAKCGGTEAANFD